MASRLRNSGPEGIWIGSRMDGLTSAGLSHRLMLTCARSSPWSVVPVSTTLPIWCFIWAGESWTWHAFTLWALPTGILCCYLMFFSYMDIS